MDKIIRPQFGKTFRGYDPKQVNDYITRLEYEIEIVGHQQEKSDQEVSRLRDETDRMKNQVNVAWTEAEEMRSKNSQLNASIQDLESTLQEIRDENARLRAELRHYQETAPTTEHDPETIKEAILSAQRMGQIIVDEAKQHADDLRSQADDAYASAQKELDQMIQEKRSAADELEIAAQKKCEDLKHEYNRILMDVSGFKAEMISLYRRHLELLYKLPDNGLLIGSGDDESVIEEITSDLA